MNQVEKVEIIVNIQQNQNQDDQSRNNERDPEIFNHEDRHLKCQNNEYGD